MKLFSNTGHHLAWASVPEREETNKLRPIPTAIAYGEFPTCTQGVWTLLEPDGHLRLRKSWSWEVQAARVHREVYRRAQNCTKGELLSFSKSALKSSAEYWSAYVCEEMIWNQSNHQRIGNNSGAHIALVLVPGTIMRVKNLKFTRHQVEYSEGYCINSGTK